MLRETRPVASVACAPWRPSLKSCLASPSVGQADWCDVAARDLRYLGLVGAAKKLMVGLGFKVYAPFPFFQEFKHFLMIEAGCEMISGLHSQGLGICKYYLGIGAMSNVLIDHDR